jgi:hypothetical protein
VRVVTLGAETRRIVLDPFPGVRMTLDASPIGATYIVRRDGAVVMPKGSLLKTNYP